VPAAYERYAVPETGQIFSAPDWQEVAEVIERWLAGVLEAREPAPQQASA
jgi:hypothetical protein